jgi:hypothetical protein
MIHVRVQAKQYYTFLERKLLKKIYKTNKTNKE